MNETNDTLRNMVFMSISLDFDYEAMNLTTNEDKQFFVDQFKKDVVKVPITQTRVDSFGEPIDVVVGTVTEARQKRDYGVDVYACMWVHVDAEYLQEPTTEENMGLPVGKKLHIAAIHIDDIQEINKNFYDIMLKQRDLVEQMAVRTKEEKELTEELRQKVKEEEDKKDD